jgi:hypothetical protein
MIKLVELLEESNIGAASYALAILLQVATTDAGRQALISGRIQKYLFPLAQTTNVIATKTRQKHTETFNVNSFMNDHTHKHHHDTHADVQPHTSTYDRLVYQRAVLVMCALIRQQEWRPYDPDNLPADLIRCTANSATEAGTLAQAAAQSVLQGTGTSSLGHSGTPTKSAKSPALSKARSTNHRFDEGPQTLRDLILRDLLRTLKKASSEMADSQSIMGERNMSYLF